MSENIRHYELIQSKDNPRIKQFCALAKSKKLRIAQGLFVLEGTRLVSDAVKNNAQIEYILATQKGLGEISEEAKNCTRIYEITENISKKISETQTPQGVFAVCRIPEKTVDFSSGGKFLMLCNLQDNGNLGMIMRTADALGVNGLILCNCCDVFSPKTVRATMGSVFRVPFILTKNESETLGMLSDFRITTYAAVVHSSAISVSEIEFAQNACVLIGNEGSGLSRQTVEKCDMSITINMNGTIESLNAAMAAGIMLWEMCGKDVK